MSVIFVKKTSNNWKKRDTNARTKWKIKIIIWFFYYRYVCAVKMRGQIEQQIGSFAGYFLSHFEFVFLMCLFLNTEHMNIFDIVYL